MPLGPEADAWLDHVIGLGAPEDLPGDIGQGRVHAVTLGPGLDPALLVVRKDHVGGAVKSRHTAVRRDGSRAVTACLGAGELPL